MTELIGKKAPAFSLPDQDGQMVSIDELKGKNIVLYFYPKDMTPGCTTEACDFRDQYSAFAEQDTVVLGVSPDPAARHQKFIEKHDLPFTLLADEEQVAANLYGVWTLKKNFGKEYMGIERSTFLIDKEGVVVREWRKVRVKDHVQETLEAVKALG
ncbi:thioredoxin-dependent thiol peroxidase [Domibacillus enclensis]|uniref:thioredoxin-dependent peroxiredoxin n=1 Tax=Domibacillus enclensis TaxID=1017273 RepID=A0A1N6X667_9BACI|nr:thioredoxin-dependent thiol peroxidase [Domibacillus enclensis]OXS78125.1 peroxiredoxin [Domibacillus enclensis]SIQ97823.1 peroxiredoxin Q/BCP [Domibacillus enclensis]